MKQAATILLICLLTFTGDIYSQDNDSIIPEEPTKATTVTEKKKKLNFFVISKRKRVPWTWPPVLMCSGLK